MVEQEDQYKNAYQDARIKNSAYHDLLEETSNLAIDQIKGLMTKYAIDLTNEKREVKSLQEQLKQAGSSYQNTQDKLKKTTESLDKVTKDLVGKTQDYDDLDSRYGQLEYDFEAYRESHPDNHKKR